MAGLLTFPGDREMDLGEVDGPLLLFGGPYGNLQATEAMLAEAGRLGIPPERTICTGDLVAYCAEPRATVAAVRRAGIPAVMGNCEESLARDAGDCGCGFAEDSACDRLAQQWYGHALGEIGADDRRWMGQLPRRLRFRLNGRGLLVIHGGVSSINRFVFPSTPAAEKLAEIIAARADGVIGGHSGLPFSQLIDGYLWHNAGAIGLPANDGTARVWFSLLWPDGDGIRIEHRPLSYDHQTAADRIRRAGLAEGYARAVEVGLWPSLDILPAAERAATGQAIEPQGLNWPTTARAVSR